MLPQGVTVCITQPVERHSRRPSSASIASRARACTFAGVPSTFVISDSDTTVVATVPTGALTGPVAVHNSLGYGSSSSNFVVGSGTGPTISSVSPPGAPSGATITINGGGFMTDANKRWRDIHPEVIETFQQQIPVGRYGEPHELGPLAVYLASEASSYMTGAALVIDGGYTLW